MSFSAAEAVKIRVSDGAGWDDYVKRHPGSSFYHLYGWGAAIESIFGFRRYYLEARDAEHICGMLPLIFVKTLYGKKMISVPIGVCAGALGDTAAISELLIRRATEITKELDCDYLELRNAKNRDLSMPTKDLYFTFVKPLPKKREDCLEMMPRKARAASRHAIDKGLTYDTGLQYMDQCYDIYAVNQRHLGSPVVSKKWFQKLAENFRDKTDILAVKKDGRCIAAVLTFFYKDTVLPFYGGCMPEFFKFEPNNYMYLKLQEYGVEKGYGFFDFGRSRKDSGSYHFKINQGFEPTQLYYQYYLNRAKKIPKIDPSNRAFELVRRIWKYLPLPITKLAGPGLFKYVMP